MPVWKLENGIRAGMVLKPIGYLGLVRVSLLFEGLKSVVAPGKFVFIEWMAKPVPYLIKEVHWEDRTTARIKFASVDNETDAQKLIGRYLVLPEDTIPKSSLESPDENALDGFEVLDVEKQYLGLVIRLNDSGLQSLLEVDNNGKEFMIPFHEDLVKKIDRKKRQITVDLPEGLIDLQTE